MSVHFLPHLRSPLLLRERAEVPGGVTVFSCSNDLPPCRVHAFIDGQNLFYAVKRAFGYTTPNYDPHRLAEAVAARLPDRQLVQVHFYTGVPPRDRSYRWSEFWSSKVRAMKDAGIRVVTRTLRYSPGQIVKPDGSVETVMVAREKGIDLRLALDLLRLARAGEFDAALLFSQDGDLAEVVDEIKDLRAELDRWLVVDCASPFRPPRHRSGSASGERTASPSTRPSTIAASTRPTISLRRGRHPYQA